MNSLLQIKTLKNLNSIDWELGKKLAANNFELAQDLLKMLIKDLPKEQAEINTAYQNNNLEDLHKHVHKLHGGCCYIGVPRLKQIAKMLEQAIIQVEKNNLNLLLAELNTEINLLINASVN